VNRPAIFLILTVLLGACKKENLYHDLKVQDGSGSGSYELGAMIEIEAHTADSGYVFSHWSGDSTEVAKVDSPSVSLFMPLKDVFLKAEYKSVPFYQAVIVNGTGSGLYAAGTSVDISARPAHPDSGFHEWQGDIEYLSYVKAPSASLTMPPRSIKLKATYSELPRYRLTVNYGSGSGDYLPGTIVGVSPTPPANKYFKEWMGDIQFLDDPGSESTDITMPSMAVEVTAVFENAISFSAQVLPLFMAECSTSGCHDVHSPNEALTTYQEIKQHDQDIRYRVNVGQMPPSKLLTDAQKEIIIKWVDQGSMNN
jgi:hypothetical protein